MGYSGQKLLQKAYDIVVMMTSLTRHSNIPSLVERPPDVQTGMNLPWEGLEYNVVDYTRFLSEVVA